MTKKTVSERAVLRRLNRVVAKEGLVYRKCRTDARGYGYLGDIYCVELRTNGVHNTHVRLEVWARDAGCLGENEVIAD